MATPTPMQSPQLAGSRPTTSTQRFLDIAEIRDDVVVMKDGSLRVVLLVSSVNFALKSEDEQMAILQGYIAFLNSLEEPLQIVVQSRKLNIDDYLNRLKEQEGKLTNELLKNQIVDYRQFITELVEVGQIMQKKFFVVVPYNPAASVRKGFFTRISEILMPIVSVRLREESFKQKKKDLMTRVDNVKAGLQSMSMTSVQLDTQALIELYYSCYNPTTSQVQKPESLDKLQVEA